MVNTIESYFQWKTNSKEPAIEKKYEKHKIISQWERTDVLYSFIGIYQIGIYVFYPDKCKRTDYTIEKDVGEYFSLDYLKEEFKKYEKLNKTIIDSKFIQYIDSLGNVTPIWPGGNTDKGKRSYCFDIPDIYFKRYEKWFLAMKQLYPNSCLDGIIDNEFSTDNTKIFLDNMNQDTYPKFLKHVVEVITKREKYLKIYSMSFAKLYPMLIAKAEKKWRTRADVDEITCWLTGYSKENLNELLGSDTTYGDFFLQAPELNPNRKLIKGVICGVRVEDIEEPLMQEIRYLDKLVDELSKGKTLEKIMRT